MFKSDGFTKFGSGKRPPIYNERNAKAMPSPDHYNQGGEVHMKSAPSFGFGSQ